MARTRISLFAALFVVVLGASASIAWFRNQSQRPELTVNIPADNWVRTLFETDGLASKSINEIASTAKLTRLSTTQLPPGDLEVHIWVGFGVTGVDGLILRRSSQQWSAAHIREMSGEPPFQSITELLATPPSGWEGAWKRLTDSGVDVLPDASEIDCRTYIKGRKGLCRRNQHEPSISNIYVR